MLLLLTIIACGDKTQDSATPSEDSALIDTNEEADPCAPIENSTGIGMRGQVRFEDGSSGAGKVRVQMCNADICYVAKWDEDEFCFAEGLLPPNMPYAFDLVPVIDPTTYANPLSFITPTASFTLTEPVLIPAFTHQSSTDLVFDAGNGLTIERPDNTIDISSVALDLDTSGLPFEDFEMEQIVGAWYLGPFDTHLDTPLNIQYTNTNLSAGTYSIWNGDYENQLWLETATITIQEGEDSIALPAISILSTFVITKE